LHAVVLLLVGATLLKVTLDGAYLRYVKPGARPLLLSAGAVLLVVAVLSLAIRDSTRHDHDHGRGHDHDHDDGHGHRHGRFDVAWLLLAPMLALLVIVPRALGSFTAARAGTALATASTSHLAALPDGDPVRMSLLDYASRAVYDHGISLHDRHVDLSGFLLPGQHGSWYLTRMVITCCAADAQPVKVGLTGDSPTGVHANDWIDAVGAYTTRTDADPVNAGTIPYLTITTWRPIAAPARPYE
jgi:uncharacterized repeat protein (TIGR03943 family)